MAFPLPNAALPVPMLLCVKDLEGERQEYQKFRSLITMKRTLSSQTALLTDCLCEEEPGPGATVNTEEEVWKEVCSSEHRCEVVCRVFQRQFLRSSFWVCRQ